MREPDVTIGDGYLQRWWIIPRNPYFNIYLHKFTGDDDDRALHDHPWYSVSFLLKGKMKEWYMGLPFDKQLPGRYMMDSRIIPYIPKFRSAKFAHRLELVGKEAAWTLFITGPTIREWGFHCPNGWIHWKEFTDKSGNQIGAGCGDDK